jgi:hypothetical protein
LFIVLDEKHPLALARTRHADAIGLEPSVGLMTMDATAEALGPIYCAGRGPVLIDEYYEVVENGFRFSHPGKRFFGQMMGRQESRDAHASFYTL